MVKTDLTDLLSQLDDETRVRWAKYLRSVDDEIAQKGPAAVKEHLDAALEHLLAVGWALHRCYAGEDALPVMEPLGEAAITVEQLRAALHLIPKKPEWSH